MPMKCDVASVSKEEHKIKTFVRAFGLLRLLVSLCQVELILPFMTRVSEIRC